MGQRNNESRAGEWWDDATGRSEAEMTILQGAALLSAVLIGLLRVVDAVLEAWPLPGSRVKK